MVTPRIRKEIQVSLESAPKLAKRLHLNVKTVLKWKKSNVVEDKALLGQRASYPQLSNK